MQPRAEEIHRVLTTFAEKGGAASSDGSRRRSFSLVVQGSAPLRAELRELRGACLMLDIGATIYTLAYSDILGMDPAPAGEGGLRVTVRPGCFASHAAARLRRAAPRPWSSEARSGDPLRRAEAKGIAGGAAASARSADASGGAAESGPAGTESARHESVGGRRVKE